MGTQVFWGNHAHGKGTGSTEGMHTKQVSNERRSVLETWLCFSRPTAVLARFKQEWMAWVGWLNVACSTSRVW
jgi:hypothetical protein